MQPHPGYDDMPRDLYGLPAAPPPRPRHLSPAALPGPGRRGVPDWVLGLGVCAGVLAASGILVLAAILLNL